MSISLQSGEDTDVTDIKRRNFEWMFVPHSGAMTSMITASNNRVKDNLYFFVMHEERDALGEML